MKSCVTDCSVHCDTNDLLYKTNTKVRLEIPIKPINAIKYTDYVTGSEIAPNRAEYQTCRSVSWNEIL